MRYKTDLTERNTPKMQQNKRGFAQIQEERDEEIELREKERREQSWEYKFNKKKIDSEKRA